MQPLAALTLIIYHRSFDKLNISLDSNFSDTFENLKRDVGSKLRNAAFRIAFMNERNLLVTLILSIALYFSYIYIQCYFFDFGALTQVNF